MKAGFGKVALIPPKAFDLSGYVARANPSAGLHDPICVRALYVESGQAALLVSVDVLGFEPGQATMVRQKLSERSGVSPNLVMLAATHTHAAPATMYTNGCGEVDPDWIAMLEEAILECGYQAMAAAEPACVAIGVVTVSGIARNRRHKEGPLDEDLVCIKVTRADGRLMGVVGNYACHPVILSAENRMVSAEYPGSFCRSLERGGIAAMFLTGAAGDINPRTHGDFELVDRVGELLASRATQLVADLKASSGEVSGYVAPFSIGWERPTPDQLRQEIAKWDADLNKRQREGPLDDAWVRNYKALRRWAEETLSGAGRGSMQQLEVQLQLLRLGGATIVGLPGEVFCGTGLAIKERLGRSTLISAYTNGNVGYVPTSDAYAVGGYEVEAAHKYNGYPGTVERGAAERMVECVARLGSTAGEQKETGDSTS